ncbi:hypothetical protein Cylst_1156 [Cylindrospermum stagnale PCC 7417]|uniref:Uncharacterized protein n=1 Tax=Cylindrospermum stagnale PCC 7417 TaxID=56107 RepID=K9WUH8_9NOST|nr:hypothetical protein [Cylindrospermum stagnale]AFZ23459.1 hypothetical protein Cylst_1156 [Cylindrospermum stagnale PCC 7417]
MKIFKQLPQIFSGKALKMSTYCKIAIAYAGRFAIALLAIFLWVVPTTSTFAATNSLSQEIVPAATVQFPTENITLRLLDLGESNNLLADASDYDPQISNTEEGLASIFQNFAEAWKKPNKKESLFNVCENTVLDRKTCFVLLISDIKQKKKDLINACYKPGINGKLCLDLALRQLGVNMETLNAWIAELDAIS